MKRDVSVVRLILAKRSSSLPASQPVIKEMPGSLASGTPYISRTVFSVVLFNTGTIFSTAQFFTGLRN
jgi:hypothetical protein